MHGIRFLPIALAMLFFFPTGSFAHAAGASTNCEATVYLTGDFTKGFTVAYHARLDPTPSNRARTMLGIMLIGKANASPAVELGLTRGSGSSVLKVFTTETRAAGNSRYQSRTAHCNPACDLVLRGDRHYVYADIGTTNLATWRRSDFAFVKPYVQLNAEVAHPNDSIAAVLFPIRAVADAVTIEPACAFTARGVNAARLPDGTVTFSGTYRANAPQSFVRFGDGHLSDRC
jgi:hypothetical protein